MTEQSLTGWRRIACGRAAGLACAAALLLGTATGCSEDNPDPKPLDPGPAAASTTPTKTPESSGAPTLPPEAKGTSRPAAIPLVEHYVRMLNYSAAALDADGLRNLSLRACDACARIAASVERVRRAGGSFRGGEWTVVEPKLLPAWDPEVAEVQTVVTYPEQEVYEAKGVKPVHFDAGKTLYTFTVRATSDGWRVASIEGVS